jgi:nucleoside-diphosphate-sugar epimerase
MQVLLTGHRGLLGAAIEGRLLDAGHAVHGFDLADGDDVLDTDAVRMAARGVEVIVHCAGLPDSHGTASETMAVNLLGTSNVLLAAEAERVRRVVHISSGKSLGMLERDPDYLPIDDDHRGLPSRPYGLAKWLAEEMCAAITHRSGIETMCLRPVAVFDAARYDATLRAPPAPPAAGAIWHMGVHIDLRDVATAAAAAVRCNAPKHTRLLLCAADIAGSQPTLEAVRQHVPHVPWRGGPEYKDDPVRSLIDIGRARAVLGWQPRHGWPGRV